MDMNQLFYNHQMALMEKAAAKSGTSRAANCDLTAHYAKRIEMYRARRGLKTYFTDGLAAK